MAQEHPPPNNYYRNIRKNLDESQSRNLYGIVPNNQGTQKDHGIPNGVNKIYRYGYGWELFPPDERVVYEHVMKLCTVKYKVLIVRPDFLGLKLFEKRGAYVHHVESSIGDGRNGDDQHILTVTLGTELENCNHTNEFCMRYFTFWFDDHPRGEYRITTGTHHIRSEYGRELDLNTVRKHALLSNVQSFTAQFRVQGWLVIMALERL